MSRIRQTTSYPWVGVNSNHVPNTYNILKSCLCQPEKLREMIPHYRLTTRNEQTSTQHLSQSSFKELRKWYSAFKEVNFTHIEEKNLKIHYIKIVFPFHERTLHLRVKNMNTDQKAHWTAERMSKIELRIPSQSPQASKARSIKKYVLCWIKCQNTQLLYFHISCSTYSLKTLEITKTINYDSLRNKLHLFQEPRNKCHFENTNQTVPL